MSGGLGMPAGLNKYAGAAESADVALDVFLRTLERTFGDGLVYVGTTTPPDEARANGSADLDLMLVFTEMSEARIRYCGQIIQQLRQRFHIAFDVRLYDAAQVRGTKIPLVNRFLLKRFLRDIHGINPFGHSRFSATELSAACLKRIEEQQEPILEALSLVSCQWPFGCLHWWPSGSLHPHSSLFFGVVRLDLASFMR